MIVQVKRAGAWKLANSQDVAPPIEYLPGHAAGRAKTSNTVPAARPSHAVTGAKRSLIEGLSFYSSLASLSGVAAPVTESDRRASP